MHQCAQHPHPPEPESRQTDAGQEALADALQTSFRLLRWLMLIILAGYFLSGVFIVKQHEKAFVLRLGAIAGQGEERIKGPGLHWTWPRPLSEVVKVATERVYSLETDAFWLTQLAEGESPRPRAVPGVDGYTLTGDANLLHSRWSVRYTVTNPERYHFGFKDADKTIRRALETAVISASGSFPVDGALRTDIAAFRAAVETDLRSTSRRLGFGIHVQGVDILDIAPPPQVIDAFAQVIQSEQAQAKAISDARAYQVRTMNEAQGELARILAQGRAAKEEMLSRVRADVDYFNAIHEKMASNPRLIQQTLHQDGVRRALSSVDHKYILPARGEGEREVRIHLSPERPKIGQESN